MGTQDLAEWEPHAQAGVEGATGGNLTVVRVTLGAWKPPTQVTLNTPHCGTGEPRRGWKAKAANFTDANDLENQARVMFSSTFTDAKYRAKKTEKSRGPTSFSPSLLGLALLKTSTSVCRLLG